MEGVRLDGKWLVNFWRGFRIFRDRNYEFTSRFLTYYLHADWKMFMTLDLIFMCRLKDVINLFHSIKGFFDNVSILWIADLRWKVLRSYHVLKCLKISYFSFTFMLNEKKMLLKNAVWRDGVTRKFLLKVGFEA